MREMTRTRTGRTWRWAILALTLCLGIALAASPAMAQKKGKKKKGPGSVNVTNTTNLPILDEVGEIDGVTRSTITVGKQFKGRRIRDVNVTINATGTGTDSVADLDFQLQAPNGMTTALVSGLDPGNLLGPLTLDDETFVFPTSGTPPVDPTGLYTPWQGTAYPQGSPLAGMDDGPVRGAWNLVIRDDDAGNTNTLVFWRLNVVVGKPYQAK
jgi:subtilisin-like proprotein convertase family protein